MSIRNYIVTANDQSEGRLTDLAERLREAGFDVVQQLDAIGVIVGRADHADLPRIRTLRGVGAVEEERTVVPSSADDDLA
jgi:hypothetical protein